MIRKLKYADGVTNIFDIIEHNDNRYEDIKKDFKIRKNQLLSNPTKSELIFEEILKKSGIFYIREKCFFSENADLFYSDFYIPSLRLSIEIDGGYHNNKDRKYLDEVKKNFLLTKSIATIRFKNEDLCDIKNISKKFLKDEINKFWINESVSNKREWEEKISTNKAKQLLKSLFSESLKKIDVNRKVVMYTNNHKWVFDNIFILHFSTELKFKEVIKRLNNYNKRLKYNIEYL